MNGGSTDAPAILFVHPNCEFYGSDRVFIQAIRAVRARWPRARITIILPGEGPLADALRAMEPDVQTEALSVPRRAKLAGMAGMLARLPGRVRAARRRMAGYDLTYINTLVLLDYLIASRFGRGARLIHVHEIPTGAERRLFARLLAWSRGRLVFISRAVRDTFPELAARKAEVIWNGTRDFAVTPLPPPDGPLRLLLIGRFNSWKGQAVLLDALALLSPAERAGLAVRLVGSTFEGADHFAKAIHQAIDRHALRDCVEVHDFAATPDAHYQWAEAVVVPSTKPEPFGLVTIEAMASGRAVIAADHGGLTEIVVDGVTGTLFPPRDAAALADVIRRYRADRTLGRRQGAAGRRRYEQQFRESVHMERIADAVATALAERKHGRLRQQ